MDLVALANYSGNAAKAGSDATMALIASEASGIRKGDLSSLKGKRIAASFGTINHLYALALLEKAGRGAGESKDLSHSWTPAGRG